MFAAKHISSSDSAQSAGVEKAIKSSCSNYIWTCSYVSRAHLLEGIPGLSVTRKDTLEKRKIYHRNKI